MLKISPKQGMCCCEFSYVTAEGDSRLRVRFASLSVARNKSCAFCTTPWKVKWAGLFAPAISKNGNQQTNRSRDAFID